MSQSELTACADFCPNIDSWAEPVRAETGYSLRDTTEVLVVSSSSSMLEVYLLLVGELEAHWLIVLACVLL